MNKKFVSVSQVLQQAKEALERGEKHEARYWAQIAASMAPNMEEPWLILAAVANSRASIAYLERALKINPKSECAQKELDLARRKQLNENMLPVIRETETSSPAQVEAYARSEPVVQNRRHFLHISTPLAVPDSCPASHRRLCIFLGRVKFLGVSCRTQPHRHLLSGQPAPLLVAGLPVETHLYALAYGDLYPNPESISNSKPDRHIHLHSHPTPNEHFPTFR